LRLEKREAFFERAVGHGAFIDERGKIIYGDVSLDASVEFVLAQKLGLIDEASGRCLGWPGEISLKMRLGGSDECEHQSA
jgi:hypothetical protein